MDGQSDKAGWTAMSSRRRPIVVGAVALALVAAAGCDTDDGRTLAEPPPGATAPPRPTGTTTSSTVVVNPPVGSEEGGPVLGSPAFGSGLAIPDRYACGGDNVSPPLGWTGLPAGTVELALTVVDPDAPGGQFVHWVVTGIDPGLTGLDEDAVPEGAIEARNDTSEFGWFGPCPPPGETHNYVFTLFALAQPSGVVAGTSGQDAIRQIAATPGAAATLTGTFTGP
jgi:Raf kinase inhibitor-like YbhB/YbcL family protein